MLVPVMPPTLATLLPKCKRGGQWGREQRRTAAGGRTAERICPPCAATTPRSCSTCCATAGERRASAGSNSPSGPGSPRRPSARSPPGCGRRAWRRRRAAAPRPAASRAPCCGWSRTPGTRSGVHLDRDELTAVLVDLAGTRGGRATRAARPGRRARRRVATAAAARGARRCSPAAPGGPLVACSASASRCPARSTTRAGVLHRVTGFPAVGRLPAAGRARRGGSGCRSSSTRTPTPRRSASPLAGRGAAPSRICTSARASAPGSCSAGRVHRGARTGAGEFGHQVVQLDGPPCELRQPRLHRGAVPGRGGARRHGARRPGCSASGAANLVGLLDIDRVLLGGRTVAADPEAFVRGVAAVLAEDAPAPGRARTVPVDVVPGGARAVAEGAAQLVLAPLFALG